MNWLFEDPWPVIWIAGAVIALLSVGYYHSRHRGVLAAIIGVLFLASACLLVEQLVVTEREQVEQTLREGAAAVKRNDLAAVLALIAPEATAMRSSVQTILPTLDVTDAGVGGDLKIEIQHAGPQPTATAAFTGRITINSRTSGERLPHETYFRHFTVQLRKEGDRWLMTGYEANDPPRPGEKRSPRSRSE